MKNKSMLLITSALSLSFVANVFGAINVNVNGKTLNLSNPPKIINGRTLVPVRAIFEELGAEVRWEPEEQRVVGIKGDKIILMIIDTKYAAIGNLNNKSDIQTIELDSPATIINGSTYVPARFVAESLGANVSWNADSQTVIVSASETPQQNEVPFTSTENGIASYLSAKYSSCETPLGTVKFTFNAFENDSDTTPYDFSIWVNYDSYLGLFSDIEHSIKYTDAQKNEAKRNLKEHMNNIANDLIGKMPSKKITGKYICSWYKYPNIREGYESRTAYTWKNYSGDILSMYSEAKKGSFQWDSEYDDFFTK